MRRKLAYKELLIAEGSDWCWWYGPGAVIHPSIDGRITSYFEWMGAGTYQVDARSGSMHGKRFLVDELHYGSDLEKVHLRIDFHAGSEDLLAARRPACT